MVMAGALERAAARGQPRFTVKGGIALELRLRNRARATKDIDVVLQHADADLARTLEGALSGEAYQGFTFRRKGEPLLLDNGAVNLELAVSYLPARPTTEPRFLIVGQIKQAVWTATVTYRHEEATRIISVRRARDDEQARYLDTP